MTFRYHPSIVKAAERMGRPSRKPSIQGRKNPNWKGGITIIGCEECGQPFAVPHNRSEAARFCSKTCANQWQSKNPYNTGERVGRVTKVCPKCGNQFRGTPGVIKRKVYCSRECELQDPARYASKETSYSRARRGRRTGLGKAYWRSAWEANYARYLNFLKDHHRIADWSYESKTFWFEKIKRGVRSYTPDFCVETTDGGRYWVEVKGWMDPKSQTKIKRFRRYYPDEKLEVVDAKAYRALARAVASIIKDWET